MLSPIFAYPPKNPGPSLTLVTIKLISSPAKKANGLEVVCTPWAWCFRCSDLDRGPLYMRITSRHTMAPCTHSNGIHVTTYVYAICQVEGWLD